MSPHHHWLAPGRSSVVVPCMSCTHNFTAVSLPASSVIGSTVPNDWTIEAWVLMDDFNNYRTVLGCGASRDEWLFGLWKASFGDPFKIVFYQSGGTAGNRFLGNGVVSSANYPTSGAGAVWTHIALTWDHVAGKFNSYVNGSPDVVNAAPLQTVLTSISNTGRDLIGDTTSSEALHGFGCEVRFWNVARTAAEIADYYNQRAIGTESGLVASFPFSEGSGATVTDVVAGVVGTRTDTSLAWSASGPTLLV